LSSAVITESSFSHFSSSFTLDESRLSESGFAVVGLMESILTESLTTGARAGSGTA